MADSVLNGATTDMRGRRWGSPVHLRKEGGSTRRKWMQPGGWERVHPCNRQ